MPKFFLSISVMILTSVAAFAHTIDTDYCDSALYTEEVFNLKCTNKNIEFKSKGLPSPDHILMQGITATNQQVPRLHDYDFKITRKPKPSSTKTKPDSGAIGVAVNGVPLFDPTTQGRVNPATGSRPNTLLEGELDKCGGHAGRGDDYHYHIAPVCLIEQLGKERIDDKKQPIGFAMDGYPIHALGWFDNANNIEDQLDECRGYTDSKGRYFYNVMTQANWDILTCFTGKPKRFAKDKWAARKDKNGNDIVGYPVKFDIKNYSAQQYGAETCHVVTGTIPKEQLLRTNGSTIKINDADGSIFYCNPSCYAMFFEADKKPQFKGRVIYYERVTDKCPARFSVSDLILFEAYEGPPQTYKAPQSTKK